jgi:2-oxoglutarate dehydrogenase E2 component (dihydrolipoamide succinyltransferase)
MSDSVQMPALGESVTEGTVTRWLKQVGDRVEVDEPLLEVSTDKVDTEIPSPVAGVVEEILVAEDETVEVGAPLVRIGDGSGGGGNGDSGGRAQQAPAGQQTQQAEQQAPSDGGQTQPQQEAQPQPAPQAQPQPEAQPQEAPAQAEQQPAAQPAEAAPASGGDGSSGGGTRIQMPALGESVTEGTVTRWLKREGDSVDVDEPLLEVSTDKVDTEIPSPVGGIVQKILVSEDETVAVGADLAIVGGTGGGSDAGDSGSGQAPQQASTQAATQQVAPDEGSPQRSEPQVPAQQAPAPQPQQQAPAQAQASTAQAPAPAQPASAQTGTAETGSAQVPAQGRGGPADGAGYVTPLVRRMATENGVDLSTIQGTGVGGRIRKQDVLDAAKAKQAAEAKQAEGARQPAPSAQGGGGSRSGLQVSAKRGTTEKMSRLRKVIATRMVESLQVSAQLTTVVEVDVTRIARLRNRAKNDFAAREGVKLSFLPFFSLATVEALKQHPTVNASVEGDDIVYHAQENLGIAVDTEKGLIVPVIKDAGDLNIAGLARKIADLAERTRNNRLTPDEVGGGTFTLTNTGSRGALFDTPIINQPQVGILGTGAVVKRPVVVTDEDGSESIAVRSMAYLALSYDHRIVDGADAARFLTTMKERLEEGAFEADLGL